MDGASGPLRSWERLYWGVFVSAIAYFLYTRMSGKEQEDMTDPEACLISIRELQRETQALYCLQ